MQKRDRAGWVRHEYGNAVGDGHRESNPARTRKVTVRRIASKPSAPPVSIFDYVSPVHLYRRRESRDRAAVAKCRAQGRPAVEQLPNGRSAGHAEVACGARRHDRSDVETGKLLDRFVGMGGIGAGGNLSAHDDRSIR
jgi:hypothetical protein